jgi:hypothetical protein
MPNKAGSVGFLRHIAHIPKSVQQRAIVSWQMTALATHLRLTRKRGYSDIATVET